MKQEASKRNATEKPCCEKTGNAKEQDCEAGKSNGKALKCDAMVKRGRGLHGNGVARNICEARSKGKAGMRFDMKREEMAKRRVDLM